MTTTQNKGDMAQKSKLAKNARELTGLNISEFAKLLGIAQSAVSHRERADRPGTYLSWCICRLIVALIPDVCSPSELIAELDSVPSMQKNEVVVFAVLIRVCLVKSRFDLLDAALGFSFSQLSTVTESAVAEFLASAQRRKMKDMASALLAMSKVENNE